jgi:hypothetical protein
VGSLDTGDAADKPRNDDWLRLRHPTASDRMKPTDDGRLAGSTFATQNQWACRMWSARVSADRSKQAPATDEDRIALPCEALVLVDLTTAWICAQFGIDQLTLMPEKEATESVKMRFAWSGLLPFRVESMEVCSEPIAHLSLHRNEARMRSQQWTIRCLVPVKEVAGTGIGRDSPYHPLVCVHVLVSRIDGQRTSCDFLMSGGGEVRKTVLDRKPRSIDACTEHLTHQI